MKTNEPGSNNSQNSRKIKELKDINSFALQIDNGTNAYQVLKLNNDHSPKSPTIPELRLNSLNNVKNLKNSTASGVHNRESSRNIDKSKQRND